MRTLGILLLTVGILFGIIVLLAIAGIFLKPVDMTGQDGDYVFGYYSGIFVGILLLVLVDFLLIKFGLRFIKKSKRTKQSAMRIDEIENRNRNSKS